MTSPKALYFLTGKGGVGKTTIALSFCKYLQKQGHDTLYAYFKQNSLVEDDEVIEAGQDFADLVGVKTLGLDLEECAENYIARKLHSRLIAKGVVKTPFFRALINMMPGFNYLIYLGQILQYLKDAQDEGKKLSIVLDSPSSGHALTMLEATANFQKIFQSGLIFEDTMKMLNLLNSPGFSKAIILTIPTQLAVNEGQELSSQIDELSDLESDIILNNSISRIKELEKDKAPEFLVKKMDIEEEILQDSTLKAIIPHSLKNAPQEIIQDLLPHMENLV